MSQTIVLTESEWTEQYGIEERTYEDFGADLNFINSVPASFVWTAVDNGETTSVVNGRAYVNRICYYVGSKPHNTNDVIVVDFEED